MLVYDFAYAVNFSYARGKNICLSRDDRAVAERLHGHNYYEISYTYHGKGVHVINGISYPVEEGTLILFSKNDIHSFYSLHELSMINCCFASRKNLIYFPVDESTLLISLNREQIEEVEAVLKTIEIELNQKESYYEQIVQRCVDTLLLILSRNTENKITGDPIWGNLLSYISENFASVTFDDAIRITNMSKSSFCRKFKQHFSVSFLTHVQQVRIQQAQRLLTSTDLTLAEISSQVGYGTNLCRFHEDFKKYTNTTPYKYKQNELLQNSMSVDKP